MQQISVAIAQSKIPFLDLAANQLLFAQALSQALNPAMEGYGLKLEAMTVQSISLPEELQKVLDQKIGMGMVGNDMGKFMQYQTAQAIPKMAEGVGAGGDAGGLAGAGLGMGAGVAMGQILAQNMQSALQGTAPAAGAAATATVGVKPEDLMATLEKLGELKSKGILTADEFNAKKAELLKKLV